MSFEDLGLSPTLLAAIKKQGYETPTPIQQQAIGPVLAGRDLLGIAQTGTGKTAAFALPILQRLATAARAASKARASRACWSCRRRASWPRRLPRVFRPMASDRAFARP